MVSESVTLGVGCLRLAASFVLRFQGFRGNARLDRAFADQFASLGKKSCLGLPWSWILCGRFSVLLRIEFARSVGDFERVETLVSRGGGCAFRRHWIL